MGLSMFTVGGIGLLLGCAMDLGPLGLYGLLSLCQTIPLSLSGAGLELYWQKVQLLPWTYMGMFAGGNLGMLLFGGAVRTTGSPGKNIPLVFIACNIGMLLGMLLGEFLVNEIVQLSNQLLAAVLMVLSMLLTMTFGMLLGLVILRRINESYNHRVIS